MRNRYQGRQTKITPLKVLLGLILVGISSFLILFILVMSGAQTHIVGTPDVMIIFGCKVELWGPSVLLQDRLDTALDYLEDNPDMTVIVSGGQGPDEPMSEAQSMADFLSANGFPAEQIILEDVSSNTWENLTYSYELYKELEQSSHEIILVSNGFHLTRIEMLFDRVWEGEYAISTLAAPTSHVPSRIKMYIREPLALVKSFVFDR